ncbi:KAP family NTPase [Alistipes sp. OttesenSCG-928-B03]|nr:KAP family NTPase [Alistipes sp. OttesenSCG-928-B03]
MITIAEDRPIEHFEDDLFGRKPIVDMISNAIISKATTAHGCYVIGVYGKWGEGKSSVFKLVKEQLLTNKKDNIVIAEFNPWLFKDQESLLLDFFNTIAKEPIGRGLSNKIKKYAPIVALGAQGIINIAQTALDIAIPSVGTLAEKITSIGESIPDLGVTLAKRKKEISQTLRKSNKHLVVFIDDIDRLDKDETHTLFKLIKQNADFDNVTYLLAMDVEMVAKAIGGRFGAGDVSDGYNFIDKIVQVPIVLPHIQSSHLKLLFNKQLNEVISALPTAHTSVAEHITTNSDKIVDILHGLFETKRDILRYTNQIQFILPTLYEEVNLFDLCLLEAIKLFHPIGYREIHRKRNVIFRQESIDEALAYFHYKDNPDELKKIREAQRAELLSDIMTGCPEKQSLQIKRIIKEHLLRPYFHDHTRASDKQLCDINYFDKYFVGCSPDDKVSDLTLYELAEQVSNTDCNNYDELANAINNILDKYGWEEVKRSVMFVINLGKDAIEKNIATKKLSIAVSGISIAGKKASFWTVEVFLCHIMNQMLVPITNPRENAKPDEDMIFETCEIIIASVALGFVPYFAAILYEDIQIAHEKKVNLVKKAIDRIIESKGADELLKVGKYAKVRLFSAWKKAAQTELNTFIAQKISEPSFDLIEFVESFAVDNDYTGFSNIFDDNQQLYDTIQSKVAEEHKKGNTAIRAFLSAYEVAKS